MVLADRLRKFPDGVGRVRFLAVLTREPTEYEAT